MNLYAKLAKVETFILDIDGVLTDGKLYLDPSGSLMRTFSVKDGYGMKLATSKGYHFWICSGGYTPGAEERLQALGVTEVHMRVEDKGARINALIKKHGIVAEQTLYLGDDIPDLPAMRISGVACCPQDAATEVKQYCDYVSSRKGGEGVVRDVIEMVLKTRGDWQV